MSEYELNPPKHLPEFSEQTKTDLMDAVSVSPVMQANVEGVLAAHEVLKDWDETCPPVLLLPECPYNQETQEALVYSWTAGTLQQCAMHLEQRLIEEGYRPEH